MRVALAQVACPWGEVEANLRTHRRHLRAAAARGADLVVFPETSVTGMYKNHLLRLCAEPLDGPIVRRLRSWARQHRIAVGFGMAERTPGKPYNSFVLVDGGGQLVGVYRKNYVTVLERDYFRKDRRRPVFELCGARVAVAICADHRPLELSRSYARRGAQLVLYPHAWDASPVLADGRVAGWKSEQDMVEHYDRGLVVRYHNHAEMLRFFRRRIAARAMEGGFCAVFVNQVGKPHPLIPFVGPAFAVDGEGRLLARSRGRQEQLVVADVDLPAPGGRRLRTPAAAP